MQAKAVQTATERSRTNKQGSRPVDTGEERHVPDIVCFQKATLCKSLVNRSADTVVT